ncbi:MAG: ATP synthase F1 subunit epsilon [Pseudomonadota bacterium]|nr:ATP synthase F1 subunit epsilon [Pseudomonadota bacterium]MEC9077486.1 ATP synthase F1 subunit epsilon [Pseudomonadota bacterium]
MNDKVYFELVSPEKLLMSTQASMVVIPGTEGDFGILAGHTDIISNIRVGIVDVYADEVIDKRVFVSGGVAEVSEDRCTILADEAILLEEIDKKTAEGRLSEAQKILDESKDEAARVTAERQVVIAQSLLDAVTD